MAALYQFTQEKVRQVRKVRLQWSFYKRMVTDQERVVELFANGGLFEFIDETGETLAADFGDAISPCLRFLRCHGNKLRELTLYLCP
jgi:hypothetical protein